MLSFNNFADIGWTCIPSNTYAIMLRHSHVQGELLAHEPMRLKKQQSHLGGTSFNNLPHNHLVLRAPSVSVSLEGIFHHAETKEHTVMDVATSCTHRFTQGRQTSVDRLKIDSKLFILNFR